MQTAEHQCPAAAQQSNADTQAMECAFPTRKGKVPVRNTSGQIGTTPSHMPAANRWHSTIRLTLHWTYML